MADDSVAQPHVERAQKTGKQILDDLDAAVAAQSGSVEAAPSPEVPQSFLERMQAIADDIDGAVAGGDSARAEQVIEQGMTAVQEEKDRLSDGIKKLQAEIEGFQSWNKKRQELEAQLQVMKDELSGVEAWDPYFSDSLKNLHAPIQERSVQEELAPVVTEESPVTLESVELSSVFTEVLKKAEGESGSAQEVARAAMEEIARLEREFDEAIATLVREAQARKGAQPASVIPSMP